MVFQAMSVTTPTIDLSPGDRVLERELRMERTDPSDPLGYLLVLIKIDDSRALGAATGLDLAPTHPRSRSASTDIGLLAYWQDLEMYGLLTHRDDPTALATGVERQQLPLAPRPLSRLRSVEGTLTAAEEAGLAYEEALKALLDPVYTPPALQAPAALLSAFDYQVQYDPETDTLRVSQSDQTCAIFANGSVVGDQNLRGEIEDCLEDIEEGVSTALTD
ncbi:hypothetical protein [Halalkalicoccus sp. NIPERK01]|uniref:hypothetical protein n=1 Tax=Halalkalicoccus sp. NIPERK01 TaxID=3053469 RepID=UPI00256F0D1D|nr:hypothetical protein [Halalkalicoccus sp. NIPERK01]MDL5363819.1 hypothetical protein [Halalkalicoccus sp. NIPERK01]